MLRGAEDSAEKLADGRQNTREAGDAGVRVAEDAMVRIAPEDIRKKGKVPKNGSLFFTIFQTFMSGPPKGGKERDVDALMRRTRGRPLPAGRLEPNAARWFAWTIAALGVAQLALLVNLTTALLAALTLISYVFAYTPLKRRTSLSTLVGAVPGALPIVGGWTASGAPLDANASVLFGILFLWQMPHFLALSWMYRSDYARAGLRMLSIEDETGAMTFRQAALNAAALIPVSLAPTALGMAGRTYFFVAAVVSGALLVLSILAAHAPSPKTARRLFLSTLVYLPVLLGVLVANRIV